MKNIKKYLLLAFIIENLLAQTRILGGTSVFFYVFLVAGGYFLLEGSAFKKEVNESCKCLFSLAMVYILYQFTLGFGTISFRTLLYLLAKVTTFIIIAISVTSDWEFYAKKTPQFFSIGVLLVLMYGLLTGQNSSVNGRQLIGFTNANTTSTLGAIAFAGFLFFRNRQNSKTYLFAMFLCLYAMLAGGSRNGMLLFAIILFMWRGVSLKSIPVVVGLFAMVIVLTEQFHIELSGIDRLIGTARGEIGANRDVEREAAIMMIRESPWTGWGFEAQNVGRAAMISELGSHSGYLETLKFMGYPFAVIWFLVLFVGVKRCLKLYTHGVEIRYHLAIVIASIISAFFEGLFVGVHEVGTNLFFVSLAVLTTYEYKQRKINRKKYVENHNNMSGV